MMNMDGALNIQIEFATYSLIISILFILLACAPSRYDEHVEILLDDKPSIYREGYIDGCGSGRSVAGDYMTSYKRTEAYSNDELYKNGWDVGYRDCKEQMEEDRELERLIFQ